MTLETTLFFSKFFGAHDFLGFLRHQPSQPGFAKTQFKLKLGTYGPQGMHIKNNLNPK
jgi:hypothetical protein